jgi:hypothetical protein
MGKHNSILDQEYLRLQYWYDPVTGQMISRRTSKPVGWLEDGYIYLTVKNKDYRLHRLIWMYLHNCWPTDMIDHINGIKTDNRLCNLRQVTAKQNAENRNKINAISGLKGVVPAHNGRWKSQIGHKGKVIYLGTYDTKEEAHDIYLKASLVFHTHNESFKSSE